MGPFLGIILKCAPLISNSQLNINKNGALKEKKNSITKLNLSTINNKKVELKK